MKRLFLILAATLVLFACGNGSKKKALTVEEQAVAYYEQMMNADGDWDKMDALMEEIEKWYDSLSEEDQEKANAAMEKAMYADFEGDDEDWYSDEEDEEDDWYSDEEDEDDDWYADEEEDEYEYEEVEEVTPVAVTNDWDEYLDRYEDFVDGYIKVSKKAMNGDVNAALELSELAIELGEYAEELEDAADEMTVSQAARLAKISEKISKAML